MTFEGWSYRDRSSVRSLMTEGKKHRSNYVAVQVQHAVTHPLQDASQNASYTLAHTHTRTQQRILHDPHDVSVVLRSDDVSRNHHELLSVCSRCDGLWDVQIHLVTWRDHESDLGSRMRGREDKIWCQTSCSHLTSK